MAPSSPIRRLFTRIAMAAIACAAVPNASAALRLPHLIGSGMVLQRDVRVEVWGWAEPGEYVRVDFDGAAYDAVAGPDGRWSLLLAQHPAGGPYTMQVSVVGPSSDHADAHTLEDIYFGDVWVCSGQSNMTFGMGGVRELYSEEFAKPENPQIRWFRVPTAHDFSGPHEDLGSGSWVAVGPNTLAGVYAVPYFFARDVQARHGIPVGLIGSAVGGSPVECWMSEDALRHFPESLEDALRFRDPSYVASVEADNKRIGETWWAAIEAGDEGLRGKWEQPGTSLEGWQDVELPGYFHEQGLPETNGVIWFRKTIDVPAAHAGKVARLNLGRIIDADTAWINGVEVGKTGYKHPARKYTVPAGLLKEGKNEVVVRVVSMTGAGAFMKDKPYDLTIDGQRIPLDGKWHYRIGTKSGPIGSTVAIAWKPLGLYNAMIAPLHRYKIKGVLWYQGEANADRAHDYKERFTTMIRDWRARWGVGDFPVIWAQLTGYGTPSGPQQESTWGELREQQRMALDLPNSAMAVTIDVGEWNDIHPLRKKEVGQRMALLASGLVYHKPAEVISGPMIATARTEGSSIRLEFEHLGSGLLAKGGPLQQFSIADSDGLFVPAEAHIDGDTVVVSSPSVPQPHSVRYAWANFPEGANLFNKEGLPASPFQISVATE